MMTTEELESLLETLPQRLLHRLARGHIHRHFRMGRQRLIHALLQLSPEHLAKLDKDLEPLRFHAAAPKASHSLSNPSLGLRMGPSKFSKKLAVSDQVFRHESGPPISLSELLSGIGVPPTQPFTPDPWQEAAINSLETSDVIVSVPTGSGKTYVAVEAMRRAMEADYTVIYTSPLKALSNTKFAEFSHLFGADSVGILTGDRRDNAQAPVLIMTTEILRNLLYDAAGGEIDVRLDTLGLIILDESQFLADPERGVVWEETIIFCPAQARLLLLSASIGNPEEVAEWIASIRSVPCQLIQHQNRSVPLRGGYLHPSGKLLPLFKEGEISKGKGYALHPESKRLLTQYEEETLGFRPRRR